MDPNEYLKGKLETCAQTELRPVDREFFKLYGIEDFIYRMLMLKKFRKWKTNDEYAGEIKKSIAYAVAKREPLELSWFFGGYKLWRFPSAPFVDWAELFSISYLVEYASTIANVYEPGVKIVFWAAHPSVMKLQSNIPEKDCLAYRDSFNNLLKEFHTHLPENLKVELRSFESLYPDNNEYQNELDQMIANVENEYGDGWTTDRKDKKNASSVLNIQWRGAVNWDLLSNDEKEEKIRRGPIVHDGYCRLSKIGQAVRGLGKIDLTATPIPSGSIAVGTSVSSVTKFWTGFGILEKRESGFSERILSPQQLESVKDSKHEVVSSSVIPLKNFKEILVFQEEMNFSNKK